MNLHLTGPRRVAVLALAIGLAATTAVADEFRLESPSLPVPFVERGRTDVAIEASGVEPIGDGVRVLVAHDKLPGLRVVDVATGRLLGDPITSPHFPKESKTGPKWEGMALDSDRNYYLIGSHSGKTDREKADRGVLLRFRLKDGAEPAIDDATVVRWDIARTLKSAIESEGLAASSVARRKIEGLAIREREGRAGVPRRELVIGLREPGDRVRAYAADISVPPSPESELSLKPVFAFVAAAREGVESQLTSLEYVPALGGFLVVTASEDSDNAFHGNTLWFVADGESARAREVATFEVAMKAEGLAVLGVERDARRTAVKLLISYDNDPHATKIPSRIQTVTLVRESR